MAFAFDTLGYAKHLRDAGVEQHQAEAHAEAARQFIMVELVTRTDLDATRRELETAITATRRDLEGAIDRLGLRLTVRLGFMLATAVTIVGAIVEFV